MGLIYSRINIKMNNSKQDCSRIGFKVFVFQGDNCSCIINKRRPQTIHLRK